MTDTDERTGRPLYRGLPVPWVTRWSGEVPTDPDKIYPQISESYARIAYRDEIPSDRDEHGVLWIREGLTRTGEPVFKAVHSRRQRACWTRRRCQVCGQPFPAGQPLTWIEAVSDGSTIVNSAEPFVTTAAPTCRACATVAAKMCPHLRGGKIELLEIRRFRPWGVYGDILNLNPLAKGDPPVWSFAHHVPFDNSGLLDVTWAKQLVVEIQEYTVAEEIPSA